MDELDRKLIILLQADGRASNVELARALGVSEGTVRRRLRTLLNEQIVRIVAIPDPVKLGNTTTALVGLQVDPAQVDTVASELGRIDEVQYAAVTTGAYDVFLWVALGSPEKLVHQSRRRTLVEEYAFPAKLIFQGTGFTVPWYPDPLAHPLFIPYPNKIH